MRARPFISANEPTRPFSELLAERRAGDPELRRRQITLEAVYELERQAAEASDEGERKRLQCEAEGLRSALEETR